MKWILWSMIVAAATATLADPAMAVAPQGVGRVGLGLFGLMHVPLAQEDAEAGTLVGMRGRIGVLPMLQLEPSITWINNGDAQTASGSSVVAPDVRSLGINAIYKLGGLGFSTYFTAGIGLSKVSVAEFSDGNETTYNFGLGAELGFGNLAADLSPRVIIIDTGDGSSRKHVGVFLGATWYFN